MCLLYYCYMKVRQKNKALTYGQFIMAVHDDCRRRKARGIARHAFKTPIIEFRGQQRVVIF
jgi:hypothetical protein